MSRVLFYSPLLRSFKSGVGRRCVGAAHALPLTVVSCSNTLSGYCMSPSVRYFHCTRPSLAKKNKAEKAPAAAEVEEVELPDTISLSESMDRKLAYLERELAKIRGGRASADMLNFVVVEAYGDKMPITDIAQITLKTPTKLQVSVFDSDISSHVATAIRECGLGLAPLVDGGSITLNIPKQSKEARESVIKVVAKQGEMVSSFRVVSCCAADIFMLALVLVLVLVRVLCR